MLSYLIQLLVYVNNTSFADLGNGCYNFDDILYLDEILLYKFIYVGTNNIFHKNVTFQKKKVLLEI